MSTGVISSCYGLPFIASWIRKTQLERQLFPIDFSQRRSPSKDFFVHTKHQPSPKAQGLLGLMCCGQPTTLKCSLNYVLDWVSDFISHSNPRASLKSEVTISLYFFVKYSTVPCFGLIPHAMLKTILKAQVHIDDRICVPANLKVISIVNRNFNFNLLYMVNILKFHYFYFDRFECLPFKQQLV